MIQIDSHSLITLIQALQIAMEQYNRIITNEEVDDVTDYEEFYIELEKTALELKEEYEKLEKVDSQLISYGKLVKPFTGDLSIH